MEFSEFGRKFTSRTGILALMDDLGKAMSGEGKKYMLGGGNPAHIDSINAVWRRRLQEILDEPTAMERMLANYDPPQGNPRFITALSRLLSREFGWNVQPENIAVTNGSQSSFYILFNMLAGADGTGGRKRILFPVVPEYIGYADQSLSPEDFVAVRPRIEELDQHTFKYRVDFEHLEMPRNIGAICFSRPTNPTGNVLTDDEVLHLCELARSRGIPLILDNAYGLPFPGMIFSDATPIWNEGIILTMSLSKIGLPSTRTGIIVARPEIVSAITSCNAILSLANGSVGQTLTAPLIESGEILSISRDIIRPFYREKSLKAREWIHQAFRGGPVEYAVHAAEGSLFLWLWFRNLSITTLELYERLKKRHTIVVPGQYFFFGLDEPWHHRNECIRLNYAMADEDVREGLRIIAEEAAQAVL